MSQSRQLEAIAQKNGPRLFPLRGFEPQTLNNELSYYFVHRAMLIFLFMVVPVNFSLHEHARFTIIFFSFCW